MAKPTGAMERLLVSSCGMKQTGKNSQRGRCVWWSALPTETPSANTSWAEQEIYTALQSLYPRTVNRAQLFYKGKPHEVDIFIPELPLAIEYDGPHHQSRSHKDEAKNHVMQRIGIQIIRVRDAALPPLPTTLSVQFQHNPDDQESLSNCIEEIRRYIELRFSHHSIIHNKQSAGTP